jgi:hypothetical protein
MGDTRVSLHPAATFWGRHRDASSTDLKCGTEPADISLTEWFTARILPLGRQTDLERRKWCPSGERA